MAIIANIIIITITKSSSSSSSFQNCTESLPWGHDTATPRRSRSENQRRAGFILARFPDPLAFASKSGSGNLASFILDRDPNFWFWQSLHWFLIKAIQMNILNSQQRQSKWFLHLMQGGKKKISVDRAQVQQIDFELPVKCYSIDLNDLEYWWSCC